MSHAEPRQPTHIACVGDSITFGYLASAPDKAYPSVLQGLVGESVQVENFGRNSATMLKSGNVPYWDQPEFDAATEFVEGAGASAVVSVVILLGANDSKPSNWNSAQFIADYEAMVDHFAGLSTKPVVYVGLPLATGNNPCCEISGTVIHDEQVPLIKVLAADKHLPVIDLNTPTLTHPEYFSDGVHPTDAGYAVLADLVRAGLNREPSVTFSSPSDGATLGSKYPIPLEALASGDTVSITEVEFFQGETSLGTVESAPFSLEWSAAPGTYVLTAKATDSTLASATTDPIEITVTAAPPDPSGGSAGTGNPGGSGGTAGTAGTSGGSGNAAGNAGNPSGSGGQPASGSGGSDAEPSSPAEKPDSSDGCGCRLALGNVPNSAAGFALVAASLFWARRRSGREPLRTKSLM